MLCGAVEILFSFSVILTVFQEGISETDEMVLFNPQVQLWQISNTKTHVKREVQLHEQHHKEIIALVITKIPYPRTSHAFHRLDSRLAMCDFFVETTAFRLR